jgi:hypothetical protein
LAEHHEDASVHHWEDRARIAEEEPGSFGVSGLPALVDLLPILVASTGIVRTPRQMLEDLRQPAALAS